MVLDIGMAVPDFELCNELGKIVSLSSLKGKRFVFYFYPKDDTPGCTVEGNEFSDLYDQFESLGVDVFGISKDSVESHCSFSEKYRFNHRLLSDPDGVLCEQFGVWQEKQNYGKTYMGLVRSTFIVDENGCVVYRWKRVKTKGHAQKVLEKVRGIF